MADAVPPPQYAVPAAVHPEKEQYIQQTPVWVVVIRGLQVFITFPILIMAGILIHGNAMGANGFAVACCVFTWIIVAYILVSEKVTSARGAYNIWAILSLDLVMAIFWLASLGSNAALRASFTERVTVQGCYNDGSTISSNHCLTSKRAVELAKRRDLVTDRGLAYIGAIAGLSALLWLLFIATLVFHGHTFRLWHQEHKTPSADNATVEMKAQGTPMLAPQTTGHPVHPQYTDQQQYQSQMYPPQPHDPAAYPQQQVPVYPPHQQQQPPPQPMPYQELGAQQPAYSPHGTPAPGQPYYPPQQQQPAYSPHGTPAPGQPYYPPQQ